MHQFLICEQQNTIPSPLSTIRKIWKIIVSKKLKILNYRIKYLTENLTHIIDFVVVGDKGNSHEFSGLTH